MTDIFIPIAPGHKVPKVKGWSKADDFQAEAWWDDAEEGSNVALRLDHYVMVDADSSELADWFAGFVIEHQLPTPVIVQTPRGMHFYWRLWEGSEAVPSFSLDAPIPGDLRVKSGPGQYALVPPSRTEHGEYAWLNERPSAAPYATAEAISALTAARRSVAQQEGTGAASGGLIQAGMRNTALTGFAGLMRRYGFDDEATERVLVGLNNQLTETPLPDEEVREIVRSSNRWDQVVFPDGIAIAEETGELEQGNVPEGIFTLLSSMTLPPPAEWYLFPYLPAGRLVLLDGLEGIGKGMFCAWSACQMTAGEFGESAPVIWAAAEDDPEEDIQKRMIAAGWHGSTHQDVLFFNEWPKFPLHVKPVTQLVQATGAKLVIMDPGRSFIHREDGAPMSYNDEAAIRPALQELNRMARETGATVLFVHHWNKDSQGSTRSRAGGTGAFAQVVRHRLSMGSAGKGEMQEWAIEVNKSNITKAGHLRRFRLVAHAELDTATFQMAEEIKGQDLGGWLKERHSILEGGTVQLHPGDLLEATLTSILEPGQPVPDRKSLAIMSGLSQDKVKDALAYLRDECVVEAEPGKAIVWKGR